MAISNRDQISILRNKLDTIQENAEFDRQIIATGIFEAWAVGSWQWAVGCWREE